MLVKKHLSLFLLVLIIAIGILFRFANFPNNPPSLNWDEASIGYNAYSINETGLDEYGNKYPLYLRSLDDYKQPVYFYLVVGAQKIFGYSDFSVRIPSAFFGILTILVIYALTIELIKKKEIALTSAFIFAILPWSVQFSRYGLEANVALFFILLGTLTFLKSLHKKYWLMPISILLFSISSYTYLSYKVIAPLLLFILFALFFKLINFKNKFVILSLVILALSLGLLFKDSVNSEGQTRFKGSSVLYESNTFQREFDEMQYEAKLNINLPRKLFHEIPMLTNAGLISRGYLSHFSPDFLFFNIHQRLNFTPNVGLLYLWMLPFILSGIYFLIKKYDPKSAALLIITMLIAPIPASVTFDIPHAIRVFLISIPIVIIASIGIYEVFQFLKRKKIIYLVILIILIATIFLSGWQFYRQNQIHLTRERAEHWQYGRREMTQYLMENKNKYDKIIVSNNLEWPYIFVLYYSKYDPNKYLSQGGTISGSWNNENNKFENFYFRNFQIKEKGSNNNKTLFVGKPDEFPKKVVPVKSIYYPNGQPAIYFVDNLIEEESTN